MFRLVFLSAAEQLLKKMLSTANSVKITLNLTHKVSKEIYQQNVTHTCKVKNNILTSRTVMSRKHRNCI